MLVSGYTLFVVRYSVDSFSWALPTLQLTPIVSSHLSLMWVVRRPSSVVRDQVSGVSRERSIASLVQPATQALAQRLIPLRGTRSRRRGQGRTFYRCACSIAVLVQSSRAAGLVRTIEGHALCPMVLLPPTLSLYPLARRSLPTPYALSFQPSNQLNQSSQLPQPNLLVSRSGPAPILPRETKGLVRQGAPGATSCSSAFRNAPRTFPHHQARGAGLPLHYQYRACATLPNRPLGLAPSPQSRQRDPSPPPRALTPCALRLPPPDP
jgi:hypothetical protein